MTRRGEIAELIRTKVVKKPYSLIFVFPFLFVCFCLWFTYLEISYVAGVGLVREIRDGYASSNWSTSRAERVASGINTFPHSCDWRHQDVSFTLSLAMLDRTLTSEVNYKSRAEAFQINIDRAKEAMACAPLRQRFWLTNTRLMAVASFNINELEQLIEYMRAISPLQQWDVQDRIDAYLAMPGLEYLISMHSVQQDFVSLFIYGNRWFAIKSIQALSKKDLPVEPIIAQLDLKTRNDLRERGIY